MKTTLTHRGPRTDFPAETDAPPLTLADSVDFHGERWLVVGVSIRIDEPHQTIELATLPREAP